MRKTVQFWQTLAVGAALALAVPAFVQSQERSADPSSPPATSSPAGEIMKAPQSRGVTIEDKAVTQADRALNQRIRQALSNDSALAIVAPQIHLESDNGEVTLHGSVATDEQKSTLVDKISQMNGVKKVRDQLKVGV